jgi:hypothetical protein
MDGEGTGIQVSVTDAKGQLTELVRRGWRWGCPDPAWPCGGACDSSQAGTEARAIRRAEAGVTVTTSNPSPSPFGTSAMISRNLT